MATYEAATLSYVYWQSPLVEFKGDGGFIGRIRNMNAEKLDFPDESFDRVLSSSTFEHFLSPQLVLAEMHRVLRPGGSVVIHFEGAWSCSFGYHLLQYGAQINELVPPWAHLFLSESQMEAVLMEHWPAAAPLSVKDATQWIYHSNELNRIGIRDLKRYFETSPLKLEWILPLADTRESELAPIAQYVSRFLPYTKEELLTRGFSAHLRKL